MSDSTLRITPFSTALGAEIDGVDLTRPLTEDAFARIRQAFLDHGVIFFRDQQLTPEQHIAFARRWAPIDINRFFKAVPGHPEIAEVRKEPEQTSNIGGGWHTDHSYDEAPAMGSILLAREVPPSGGDTLFSSMYAAYDALSPSMKQFLEGMTAIHDGAKPWTTGYKIRPEKQFPRAEHPLVTVHPETGRKLLFVNRGFTTRIRQLMYEESNALLEFLYQHLAHPRFQCRFRWRANSIAFWDNRCTQHQAVWDYYPARRSGHRVTIAGKAPGAADAVRVAAAPRSYPRPR